MSVERGGALLSALSLFSCECILGMFVKKECEKRFQLSASWIYLDQNFLF